MGFLDRLFGRKDQQDQQQPQQGYQAPQPGYQQPPGGQPQQAYPQQPYQPGSAQDGPAPAQQPAAAQQPPPGSADADQQAIQRYEYLLRTAPPEQIERAHEEAFAQLTPAQRAQVLNKLAQEAPQEAPRDDSPQSLARSATRIEMQRPGTLQRAFGRPGLGGRAGGAGLSMGGMLLTSVAGAFIGTAIAQELFDNDSGDAGQDQSDSGQDQSDSGQDQSDSADTGQDSGDTGGTDAGDTSATDAGFADSGSGGGFDGGGFDGGGFDGGDFGGGFGDF
ncbi:hypothetical protein [Luteipulveratus flavus]|uniref:DUF2076 domain-containing protein n=1 Tax=Luteipulveratus flavus TaxID=3031728 RepID=A0ABT6C864_9MICO|nr:hypothetical protein [Luteipulveratus sp. YIM 133296]MDF8265124.1 hypothetical protein [Luteipulveratus sp. YIM 133296]